MDKITIDRARITKKGVELKTSQAGNQYARFSVMWSSSRKNRQTGDWENGPTKFLNVKVFGTQAQVVAQWAQPEQQVMLSGKIEHFEWQGQNGPQDDWSLAADFVAPVDQKNSGGGFQQSQGGFRSADEQPPF